MVGSLFQVQSPPPPPHHAHTIRPPYFETYKLQKTNVCIRFMLVDFFNLQ